MEDLTLISRGLYKMGGEGLGTEQIVDMRRRFMDLRQSLWTADMNNDPLHEDRLLSGSECEKFRFASSDRDLMWICKDIRAHFSWSTEHQYNVWTNTSLC